MIYGVEVNSSKTSYLISSSITYFKANEDNWVDLSYCVEKNSGSTTCKTFIGTTCKTFIGLTIMYFKNEIRRDTPDKYISVNKSRFDIGKHKIENCITNTRSIMEKLINDIRKFGKSPQSKAIGRDINLITFLNDGNIAYGERTSYLCKYKGFCSFKLDGVFYRLFFTDMIDAIKITLDKYMSDQDFLQDPVEKGYSYNKIPDNYAEETINEVKDLINSIKFSKYKL